jgi:hypothetical protein
MQDIDIEKLKERKNLIDMMTSMHSELSSKYRNISLVFDVISTSVSIILLVFLFIDNNFLNELGIKTNILRLIIGIISIIVTCASIIPHIIDWKSKKTCHDQAFRSLVDLKKEWQKLLLVKEQIATPEVIKLEEKTNLILNQLIPINNSDFNKLKKKHYMKVQISKFLTKHPFVPLSSIIRTFKENDLQALKKEFQEIDDGT